MSANTSETRQKLVPALYIAGGVLILVLIGALTVWGISALAQRAALELDVVRDLFIIGLALEACIFGIVLIIMLVMVIRLVNTIEFEIKPILQKTNDIAATAKGTTQFVSDNIVQPTIKAKGYVAGAKAGAQALFTDPKKNLPK